MGVNIHLRFPAGISTEPVVCKLSRIFDLEFNITRAEISERRVGFLILELLGSPEECKRGVEYLRSRGVEVNPVDQYICRDRDICVECGMCTAICPTDALFMTSARRLEFDKEKCTVCGLCTRVCPVRALEISSEIETVQ